MAPLELYVWGPALSLPSIDPECLAVITYFVSCVSEEQQRWRVTATSPSAVPTSEFRKPPPLGVRPSSPFSR